MFADEVAKIAQAIPAQLKQDKGLFALEHTLAERKAFLSKKKLVYIAKFRIDDAKKEVRFTEMLKESGSGLSSGSGFSGGDWDSSPGFGFKKEVYKSGFGGREGTIEEQSKLFGKDYNYTFEWGKIRKAIEAAAVNSGYTFKYQITPIGL